MTRTQALEMREALSAAAQYLSDIDSARYSFLFPQWKENINYTEGFKCLYNGKLYKTIESHTSSLYTVPENSTMFEELT